MGGVERAFALAISSLILALSGLLLLNLRPSAATGYRYFGTSLGSPHGSISLVAATVGSGGGHAAVWLGASTNSDSAWVQGGIAYQGVAPFVYIEFKRPGRQPCIAQWPASFGERIRVHIEDHSARWRVLVAGHLSRSILMLRPNLISTLEILDDATGVAMIGSNEVVS